MTGIDSETSQDIAEAISLKGGRYLEAQIQGSKSQAQDGTLVVLVAGDRSLFDDCQSCFQVRWKNIYAIMKPFGVRVQLSIEWIIVNLERSASGQYRLTLYSLIQTLNAITTLKSVLGSSPLVMVTS